MQKSVPILRTDRNKFSKMPDTKTKTKNITADRHFITTKEKKGSSQQRLFAMRADELICRFVLSIYFCVG
ncbi:MAG: hypothetical protein HY841_02740 [Bacteroidetes bacterium]|nr:hypothetical protein [Bacteroidota bacterium]